MAVSVSSNIPQTNSISSFAVLKGKRQSFAEEDTEKRGEGKALAGAGDDLLSPDLRMQDLRS